MYHWVTFEYSTKDTQIQKIFQLFNNIKFYGDFNLCPHTVSFVPFAVHNLSGIKHDLF